MSRQATIEDAYIALDLVGLWVKCIDPLNRPQILALLTDLDLYQLAMMFVDTRCGIRQNVELVIALLHSAVKARNSNGEDIDYGKKAH